MKMIKIACLLTLTSCTLGTVRDQIEMGEAKVKLEIQKPFKTSFKGPIYKWYSGEFEQKLKEKAKINGHHLQAGDSVFFNEQNKVSAIVNKNGAFCIGAKFQNNKVRYLKGKYRCYVPQDLGSNFKYILPSKNITKLVNESEFIFSVKPLYKCNGIIEAIAVAQTRLNGISLIKGDVVKFKYDKIWMIKDKVIQDKFDKECFILRKNNYIIKY